MKKIIVYLLLISSFSSCISTKKTTYFQGEPISKSELHKLNNQPYRIQTNDILYVDIVANNPELVKLFKSSEATGSNNVGSAYLNGYSVDRHGNIRFPYIGNVNVLGYTEEEIRKKIEVVLGEYLKNEASFFVTVKLAGINFVVTGEVGSPGSSNLAQNQVSIIDALANSGEVTEFGDKKNIQIIRKTIDGNKKYSLDLTDIEIFESENFYIQPNDVIYVPALRQKSWGFGSTGLQNFTTISSVLTFIVSSVLLAKTL